MTDAKKLINPPHFQRDLTDIRIRTQINLAMWIRIPDYLWLNFWHQQRFALSEHSCICNWFHNTTQVLCMYLAAIFSTDHFYNYAFVAKRVIAKKCSRHTVSWYTTGGSTSTRVRCQTFCYQKSRCKFRWSTAVITYCCEWVSVSV